jgi:uncharacterized membrane protein
MTNPLVLLRRRFGTYASSTPDPNGDGHPGLPDQGTEWGGLMERGVWSLVWLGILIGAVNLWSSWTSWPVIDALAPAMVAVSFLGFFLCWCRPTPRTWYHEGLAMLGALTVITAPQVISIHTRLYYATDSAALDHVAARLFFQGHNPYDTVLTGVAALLKTPVDFWTYTVTGGHVAGVSYPAGSFLAYVPAFALGFHHQVVDWIDLYAWLASTILLFFLLPRALRWLAVLVALTGVFVGIFGGGGTDAVFLPFAMLAVWRWDRYGAGKGAGLAGWIGPLALGLACSIKQTPWFLVPFLVVGIAIECRRTGRSPIKVAGRYLAIVAGVFVAVNLAFIVMDAGAWWHGTVLPFTQPLIADGQGLVSIALHGLTGGANLTILTASSALAYLATLAAFIAWYRPLKRFWMLLIPVSFFFAPRSFTGYLIDLMPIAMVALLTVQRAPAPEGTRTGRLAAPARLAAAGLAAATGVTAGLALTAAPLTVSFLSADIGPGQQHIFAVSVAVTNNTDATVRPRFLVDVGAAHPTGFWTTPHDRPVVIGPHATVGVTLFPPAQSPAYLPPWAADYVVQAYTSNPRALSTSQNIWHNYIPKLSPS